VAAVGLWVSGGRGEERGGRGEERKGRRGVLAIRGRHILLIRQKNIIFVERKKRQTNTTKLIAL
jgi:hypothetical protein